MLLRGLINKRATMYTRILLGLYKTRQPKQFVKFKKKSDRRVNSKRIIGSLLLHRKKMQCVGIPVIHTKRWSFVGQTFLFLDSNVKKIFYIVVCSVTFAKH